MLRKVQYAARLFLLVVTTFLEGSTGGSGCMISEKDDVIVKDRDVHGESPDHNTWKYWTTSKGGLMPI